MSSKHLQKGDERPAFDNTKKFRIYSMKFCPFAQRARLVAAAKGLTNYDIVNIKLRDDLPEWYLSINPLRKVPAIEFPDGEVIYESLIVSDLLDDLYPENQLNPKDPKERARQKLYIDIFGNTFIPSYFKYFFEKSEENMEELLKNISKVEQHLAGNKSKFFAGNEAGMIDFMLWPWFERLPMLCPFSTEEHPNLKSWFTLMHDQPAVKEIAISKETYLKFYDLLSKGQPDYDFV